MHDARAYEAETDGIVVRVRPSYLAGQSDPDGGRWVWAYQVEIVNLTGVPVQLEDRYVNPRAVPEFGAQDFTRLHEASLGLAPGQPWAQGFQEAALVGGAHRFALVPERHALSAASQRM